MGRAALTLALLCTAPLVVPALAAVLGTLAWVVALLAYAVLFDLIQPMA